MTGVAKVGNKAEVLQKMVEGERMKLDLSKANWLDESLVGELKLAIKERAKIKEKEDLLEIQKKDVVAQIEVLLDTLQIDGGVLPKVGTVTKFTQDRANLDKSKLKEELLKAGLPAEVIMKCITRATSFSTSSGVRFTAG